MTISLGEGSNQFFFYGCFFIICRNYKEPMDERNFDIFKSRKVPLEPAKGRILIAEPFLQGPYFSRSIVLIVEHNSMGTIGFVLNKPSEMYPDEIVEDIYSFRGVLYIGGPVASDTLHFIHALGDVVPGAQPISDHLYWGGDFEVLKSLINSGKVGSKSVKFFAGYSGWSAGQLEAEIEEHSWVVSTIDAAVLFQSDLSDLWKATLEGLGDVYRNWTNFPVNPTMN